MQLTQYEPARIRIMDYPGITKFLSVHSQQSSDIGKSLFEELLLHLSMVNEDIHEAWKTERFQQYNGQVTNKPCDVKACFQSMESYR